MKKRYKYSFIVPAYNSEQTICRCLDSLLEQGHESYEIIVINDGSTDSTKEKIEKYRRHNNVTIIEQNNSGVSSARNTALKHATGDWICFIDSDDYIKKDTLNSIGRIIDKYNPDCIFTRLITRGKSLPEIEDLVYKDDLSRVIDSLIFREKDNNHPLRLFNNRGIGGKFIKRSIITENNISFNSSVKKFEDGLFNLHCLLGSKVVVCANCSFYYYFEDNPTSRTNTILENEDKNNEVVLSELSRLVKQYDYYSNAINDVSLELAIPAIDRVVSRKNTSLKDRYSEVKRIAALYRPFLEKTDRKAYGAKKRFELLLLLSKNSFPLFAAYSLKHLFR